MFLMVAGVSQPAVLVCLQHANRCFSFKGGLCIFFLQAGCWLPWLRRVHFSVALHRPFGADPLCRIPIGAPGPGLFFFPVP